MRLIATIIFSTIIVSTIIVGTFIIRSILNASEPDEPEADCQSLIDRLRTA